MTPPATPDRTRQTNRSTLRSAMRLRRHDRTDAHDGHLAEADDAAPAGEHHEGQRHEPVGERDRAEVDLRVGAQHRQRQHRHHHQARQHGLGRAHLAELGVGPRQPVADADDRPRRLARLGPVPGTALQQQGDDDDGEQHDRGRRRLVDVPQHELVEDAEEHAGHEGAGHRAHADDDRRGQGREQDRRAGRRGRAARPRSGPAARRSGRPGRRPPTTAAARAG